MDIPSWARAGQKVVVVKEIVLRPNDHAVVLPLKSIYTIREVVDRGDVIGIRLVEVKNPIVLTTVGFLEQAYPIGGFAPLVDTKFETDIAMFKDIMLHAHEYRDITETV